MLFYSSPSINRQGDENRNLLIKVAVDYNADIAKAKKVLNEILEGQSSILQEGRQVFVEELGDSSVFLGILVTVPVLEYNSVRRELNEKILLVFRKEGILFLIISWMFI